MRHCLVFWRNVCYHIVHWFIFCVSNICSDSFRTLSVWNGKIVFFWIYLQLIFVFFAAEFVVCFIACLSLLLCSCLEAPLCTTIVVTIKHMFKRNLACLTQLFNCFSLLFLIMHLQYILSRRAYALVHPHRWVLLSLKIEKMRIATTFTRWEGSARKYGSGISSSSFPLDDFRTWTRAPLDRCLSKARIML